VPIIVYRHEPLGYGGNAMSERKVSSGLYVDARSFGELLDLNRESVYRAIARGDLQAVRVGRSIRLPIAQLDSLVIGADDELEAR
jgi:excisionase family DNA binding protein